MGKVLKRKFGVKQIIGESRNLLCSECGYRAGLHYGSDCPTVDLKTGKPLEKRQDIIKWIKEQRGE